MEADMESQAAFHAEPSRHREALGSGQRMEQKAGDCRNMMQKKTKETDKRRQRTIRRLAELVDSVNDCHNLRSHRP